MRLDRIGLYQPGPIPRQAAVVVFAYSELQLSFTWPLIRKRCWIERCMARRFGGRWHWLSTGKAIQGPTVIWALESLT